MTNEDKVLGYIRSCEHGPLHFSEGHQPTGNSVRELVLSVLAAADNHASLTDHNTTDTYPYKNRSSIDIWRHIISVTPDVTIFEVLRTLFELIRDKEVGSLKCPRIGRRVFRLKSVPGWTEDYGRFELDEYGLLTADWEWIGEE